MASMKTSMEALKESVSQRIGVVEQKAEKAEQKAEKTENRLWYIVIAVIVAGGIPALIAEFLS